MMKGIENNKKRIISCICITIIIIQCIVSIILVLNKKNKSIQVSEVKNNEIERMLSEETITWQSGNNFYPSGFGDENGIKNLIYDIDGTYKEIYCIQPGARQASSYTVYDLFKFKDMEPEKMQEYFGNEDNYKHFLWMVENMYITNLSGEEKTKMISDFFARVGNGTEEFYNDGLKQSIRNLYSDETINDGNVVFSDNLEKMSVKFIDFYIDNIDPRDSRENLLKVIQSYTLNSYVTQPGDTHIANHMTDGTVYPVGSNNQTIKDDESLSNFIDNIVGYLEQSTPVGYSPEVNSNYKEYTKVWEDENNLVQLETNRIGPFYITNRSGNEVYPEYIKINGVELGAMDYSITDSDGNVIDLSDSAVSQKEFYISLTNAIQEGDIINTDVDIKFHIDYGNITEAQILVPDLELIDGEWQVPEGAQLLINIEKNHKDTSISWVKSKTYADIALKKYIVQINEDELTGQDSRLGTIDTSGIITDFSSYTAEQLRNKETVKSDAEYNMNKTPVDVKVGDTVTYAIQLFNEGNVDGTAATIIDHLPKGTEFIKAYRKNGAQKVNIPATAKQVDKYDNVDVEITVNDGNSIPDYIKAFEPENAEDGPQFLLDNSKTIYVECKVTDIYPYVYTNIAEISEYIFKVGTGNSDIDRDSEGGNHEIETAFTRINPRLQQSWIGYKGNEENSSLSIDDNTKHNFKGQEDDDDFEKIRVKNIDLALTKSFTSEATVNYDNRTATETVLQSNDADENDGAGKDLNSIWITRGFISGEEKDLKYEMNKAVATVRANSILVSTITVYNEGEVEGVVKEITDYLPMGLELDLDASNILNEGKDFSVTFSEQEGQNSKKR